MGEITLCLWDIHRLAPNLLTATMEYRIGNQSWTHIFAAGCLDDDQLAEELAAADLTVDAYLTEDRAWIRAVLRGTDRKR